MICAMAAENAMLAEWGRAMTVMVLVNVEGVKARDMRTKKRKA